MISQERAKNPRKDSSYAFGSLRYAAQDRDRSMRINDFIDDC